MVRNAYSAASLLTSMYLYLAFSSLLVQYGFISIFHWNFLDPTLDIHLGGYLEHLPYLVRPAKC